MWARCCGTPTSGRRPDADAYRGSGSRGGWNVPTPGRSGSARKGGSVLGGDGLEPLLALGPAGGRARGNPQYPRRTRSGPCPAVPPGADNGPPDRADTAQPQPDQGLRLPGVWLAGTGPGPPAAQRVLRERRQARQRRGDVPTDHGGVLPAAPGLRTGQEIRPVDQPAGPAHGPWSSGPARTTTSQSAGRRRSGCRPRSWAGWTPPMRPSSTPPAE